MFSCKVIHILYRNKCHIRILTKSSSTCALSILLLGMQEHHLLTILCNVLLHHSTLYCAKGNYEFGISRVIKSLEPYSRKVCGTPGLLDVMVECTWTSLFYL